MRSPGLGSKLPRGVPGWEPPGDAQCAEDVVAPFRDLSPDERLAWQSALVRSLLALAGPRAVAREDAADALWRVWRRPPGAPRPH